MDVAGNSLANQSQEGQTGAAPWREPWRPAECEFHTMLMLVGAKLIDRAHWLAIQMTRMSIKQADANL